MKINEYRVKRPEKQQNKTYIIGNAQTERELRLELEAYAEEVRNARVELDQMGEFKKEYERRGRLLTTAQKEASKVPGLLIEIEDLRLALHDMSRALRED